MTHPWSLRNLLLCATTLKFAHATFCMQIAGMLRGEAAPWEAGGNRSGTELMLGRKYFMAKNDLARCKEQLQFLVVEKRRLASYFTRTIDSVDATIAQFHVDLQAPDHMLTVAHGQVFWLKQHVGQLRVQNAELVSKLPQL